MGKAIIAIIIVVVLIVLVLGVAVAMENVRNSMATKCNMQYNVGSYANAERILENAEKKYGEKFAGGRIYPSGDNYSNDVEYCWYKYR